MRIKRFIGPNIEAVMNKIKEEFGDKAVILSEKKEEGFGVEVVAGFQEEAEITQLKNEAASFIPLADESLKTATNPNVFNQEELDKLTAKHFTMYKENLNLIKKGENKTDVCGNIQKSISEIKELILNLTQRQALAEKLRDKPEIVKVYRSLSDWGVKKKYARYLIEKALEKTESLEAKHFIYLQDALKRFVKIANLKNKKHLALIGPSGVGKSSALVKLIAYYRKLDKQISVISLDTLRLGAANEISQYARILDVPLSICQNKTEFKEALLKFSQADLVLIDTPGRFFNNTTEYEKLLSTLDDIDTLLILSATMKDADIQESFKISQKSNLAGLIFTKFDISVSYGNIINTIIKFKPEFAFFSLGDKVPGDFVEAQENWIVNTCLPYLEQKKDEIDD